MGGARHDTHAIRMVMMMKMIENLAAFKMPERRRFVSNSSSSSGGFLFDWRIGCVRDNGTEPTNRT